MPSKGGLSLKGSAMNGIIFKTKLRNTIQLKKPLSATKTTTAINKDILFNKLKWNITTKHRNYWNRLHKYAKVLRKLLNQFTQHHKNKTFRTPVGFSGPMMNRRQLLKTLTAVGGIGATSLLSGNAIAAAQHFRGCLLYTSDAADE